MAVGSKTSLPVSEAWHRHISSAAAVLRRLPSTLVSLTHLLLLCQAHNRHLQALLQLLVVAPLTEIVYSE